MQNAFYTPSLINNLLDLDVHILTDISPRRVLLVAFILSDKLSRAIVLLKDFVFAKKGS